MIKKWRPSAAGLARQLGIPKSRGVEAVLKAQLIAAVTREIERRRFSRGGGSAFGASPNCCDRHSFGQPAESDD